MKSFVIILSFLVLPVTLCIGQPYSGNFTINQNLPASATNFFSFEHLANNLFFFGVSGNVTVTVEPGTGPYIEQVDFLQIPGTGPNAMIYIEGSGEEIRFATTTTDRHVLRLSNQSYFTINNLHVARDAASTGGFYGIHIYGTGNHITISNCEADISGTTSTLYGGFVASGSWTSLLATGDFHNITFSNNKSTGGGYGISLFGLLSNLASNISIIDNELTDFHSNGIYLRETNGVVVSGNTLRKTTPNVTTANAIQLAQSANVNGQIFNNFIEISQPSNGTMTFRGIYLFNGTGHKVYNNVIHSVMLTSGNFTGIEVRTGGTAPEIYFNTISIDHSVSTTGNLAGIKEELSNTLSVIRNNMISISQPCTGTKSALVLASNSNVATAFNSNYNVLWVPGGNIAQKGGGITSPVFYSSLSTWQTTSGKDMQSQAVDPGFANLTLPVPTNPLVDNTGTPISWITEDVLGVLRSNPPDIGAFEFSPGPPPAPQAILGDTSVCDNALVQTYFVNPVAGASGYTWAVTPGMTILSGQGTTTVQVNVGNGGSISVFASNISGNSALISRTIYILPAPVVSLNLPFDTLCINATPYLLSGGVPSGGQFSGTGVSAGVFTPSLAGVGLHQLVYTFASANGCLNTASAVVDVELCAGIPDLKSSDLLIYPNPFSGNATLRIAGNFTAGQVFIYRSDGSLVHSVRVSGNETDLSHESLYPGVYQIVVISEEGKTYQQKLIVSPQ